MITANLKGGLGNLMFQIAACLGVANGDANKIAFSRRVQGNIHWNNLDSYEKSVFQRVRFVDTIESGPIYTEKAFHFSEPPQTDKIILDGYFQSERYFNHVSSELKSLFAIPDDITQNIIEHYGHVLQLEPVAIHVRRGDYVKLQHVHPPCSPQYYREAIKRFPKGTNFIVFSDDIEWCKKVFRKDNFYFIEGNTDFEDLYLFSMCKNHIISNSTFGWWGAWLSENDDKTVIAPSRWFAPQIPHNTKDLIPEDWVLI